MAAAMTQEREPAAVVLEYVWLVWVSSELISTAPA